jgi:hypothetical protein
MAQPEPPSDAAASSAPTGDRSAMGLVLVGAGLVYAALGIVIGGVVILGGLRSALFPTGWLFPALLIVSGLLMVSRRRFDIAVTLWGAFTLAVFMLGVLVYMNALDRGLDDAAAFDASLIAAAFGLIVLVLRPAFRS